MIDNALILSWKCWNQKCVWQFSWFHQCQKKYFSPLSTGGLLILRVPVESSVEWKETKSDFFCHVSHWICCMVTCVPQENLSVWPLFQLKSDQKLSPCEDGLATFMSFLISQKQKVLNKFFSPKLEANIPRNCRNRSVVFKISRGATIGRTGLPNVCPT